MRLSLVLLPVSIAALAVGLYWLGVAVEAGLSYARNSAACGTAPNCGTGPPPVDGLVAASLAIVAAGLLILCWGLVRRRYERRGQSAPTGA